MSKPLARFKTGQTVTIRCYKEGCENVRLQVKLGVEDEIHPSFTGEGRFHWQPGTPARTFDFAYGQNIVCPICQTRFGTAIMVSNGKSRKATVFGYEPEPA